MKAILTSVRDIPCTDEIKKVASLYDFWAMVHSNAFPNDIEIGKLDSYGTTTKDFVLDLTWRDIDTRFQMIPKSFTMDHITLHEELEEPARSQLRDHLEKYFAFRATIIKAKAKPTSETKE